MTVDDCGSLPILPAFSYLLLPWTEKTELALWGLVLCKRNANTRRRVEPIDISMMRKLKGFKPILKMGKNGTKAWQNGSKRGISGTAWLQE
jgi:hypothetical protein